MAMTTTKPGYGSPLQIAQYTSLSLKTVRRLYTSGQLASRQINRRIIISYEDAEAFIRRSVRRMRPAPAPTASTVDGQGRALAFAPAEAHQRTRLALETLDALAVAPANEDEAEQGATLAHLEASLHRGREGGSLGATG